MDARFADLIFCIRLPTGCTSWRNGLAFATLSPFFLAGNTDRILVKVHFTADRWGAFVLRRTGLANGLASYFPSGEAGPFFKKSSTTWRATR